MSKEYFVDNISDESLAKITDKMLRFEKIQKSKRGKLNILKMVPAVAAIALVIGLANFIGLLNFSVSEYEFTPGANNDNNDEVWSVVGADGEQMSGITAAEAIDRMLSSADNGRVWGVVGAEDWEIPEIPLIDPLEFMQSFIDSMFDSNINEEDWNARPWIMTGTIIDNQGMNVFTLKDGTTIETAAQYNGFGNRMQSCDGRIFGFMRPMRNSIINLANGITIDAPGGSLIQVTVVEDADHEVLIIIGEGEATITQPDGTSSAMASGTALDGKGNIIQITPENFAEADFGFIPPNFGVIPPSFEPTWFSNVLTGTGKIYMQNGSINIRNYCNENPDWNMQPWTRVNNQGMGTYTLKNGTTIETISHYVRFHIDNSLSLIIPTEASTIYLANGLTVRVPGGTAIKITVVKDADHELEIITGDGDATITKPDGASITIPSGTVLDGEGNIIE